MTKVVALAGGVGGAKLAHGLSLVLSPDELTIIVNTGDDFVHWGLNISPDLDTVCYTLAELANPETGWGRQGETWQVFMQMSLLGAPDWFRLGDRDLATHLERTRLLQEGLSLSEVTEHFCKSWGVQHCIIPMSNDPVPTLVDSDEGILGFQDYFVARRCEPVVKGFEFRNIGIARPSPGVIESLQKSDLIIFCPSNPWVSLDPILGIPGIKPLVLNKPVVAVSPIIGGKAVKGPAAKMYRELGIEPSALAVAEHYHEFVDVLVIDMIDSDLEDQIKLVGAVPLVSNTIMKTNEEKQQLASEILDFSVRKGIIVQ
ncbi:MAG: 2-phospho-L-lactate transferase [Anaerolineales bacterium]|nr:2-phospho-L-lactate transferase [Anaerolineales bacterium]